MPAPEMVKTNLAAGQSLTLITCGVCYGAVVERFWDDHLAVHQRKGELGDAGAAEGGGTDD